MIGSGRRGAQRRPSAHSMIDGGTGRDARRLLGGPDGYRDDGSARAAVLAPPLHSPVSGLIDTGPRSLFLFGYLATWVAAAGAISVAVMAVEVLVGRVPTLGVALIGGALWQFAPVKRSALRRCDRTVPIAAHSWRADLDRALFGVGYRHQLRSHLLGIHGGPRRHGPRHRRDVVALRDPDVRTHRGQIRPGRGRRGSLRPGGVRPRYRSGLGPFNGKTWGRHT